LMDELITQTDPGQHLATEKQIDQILWDDLFNVPLFTFPAVYASAKNVEGLVYNPTQADLTWNAGEWSAK
ncbi:MAG TPA: hypothetical protein VE781_06525, partial [Kineosporiaceae bacterium]|nr:hypothetical protein [Kineosporiaceae bacterium]